MKGTLLWVATMTLSATMARAGAPAPSVHVEVWPEVPLGAPIRVELRAIMSKLVTKRISAALLVRRAGKVVVGRWRVDRRAHITCGTVLRLAFAPAAPLVAGMYQVTGFKRLKHRIRLLRSAYPVKVQKARDTRPPTFAGLQAATCVYPNPLLGCRPHGIRLVSPAPTDPGSTAPGSTAPGSTAPGSAGLGPRAPSSPRLVIRYRRRGAPYRPQDLFEARLIRYTGVPGADPLPRGEYIFTQRARDAADNEGGRICEVALKMPLRGCRKFPRAKGKRGRRSAFGQRATGRVNARCARRVKGRWISAIDGVHLSLP